MKTLLYFQGSSSSGESNTPDMLRNYLPDWNIVSPDIPIEPKVALHMLHCLCDEITSELYDAYEAMEAKRFDG